MERRDLLRGALASTLLPAWASGAFAGRRAAGRPGQEHDEDGDRALALVRAYEAAQADGRPLLVMLVPEEGPLRRAQGEAWGQLLSRASDETLADLALCDFACAEEWLVRAALGPRIELAEPGAPALVIETGPARAVRVDVEIDEVEFYPEEECVPAVQARIERMGAALHALLAGDGAILARRLEECASSLGLASDELLEGGAARLEGTWDERIERAPALLRVLAERATTPADRARWLAALASSLRARLKGNPPLGARWGRYTGCGEEIEGGRWPGEPHVGVSCGMGHVPKIAKRFLHFMTQ